TNDARLVLDTLRSAAAHGATLLNYTPFESARRDGEVWICRLAGNDVGARTIVNAAGAWGSSFPQSQVKLRLTKGVHGVIDRSRLNIRDAVVMTDDSRILFAIPWGERVILGTTDTDYAGPIDSPTCDEQDLRYILNIVNDNFPAAAIT